MNVDLIKTINDNKIKNINTFIHMSNALTIEYCNLILNQTNKKIKY